MVEYFTGSTVPDGERMTQEEFSLMGKPWIKPTKGMRVGLSHLAPKFVREMTHSLPRGKNRLGRIQQVHANPLDGSVWADVMWDAFDDEPPAFHTGYHCGKFGNFHLVLKDQRILSDVRQNLDETLPEKERGKLPLRITDSSRNFARPPTVQSSGMHTTETLDRLKTPARLFHAAQTVEWNLDPQGSEKTNERLKVEMQFWQQTKKEERERMKDEGSAGQETGRARNKPQTAPAELTKGKYSAGGQIDQRKDGSDIGRERGKAPPLPEKGAPTHLVRESLRKI
uniref:Uncharacterized protein n=2 Tax=Hemiselmis andersenii TaxID=464988 RepID=A0A7S1DS20_HEMAN|mmetsp:Transcript_25385/g.61634  ORF Transcript_25385/g.61634 Transcript_25385/m.61634 type:complete len:283 (+) Transcript_25385:188-1036(+)